MTHRAGAVEWSPKACTLILNGLSHLFKTPADAEPGTAHHRSLRRVLGYAADCLVLQEPEALAPRHISLSLNALARLLPLLGCGDGDEEAGTDWGLFVSVMVSRYVCVLIVSQGPTPFRSCLLNANPYNIIQRAQGPPSPPPLSAPGARHLCECPQPATLSFHLSPAGRAPFCRSGAGSLAFDSSVHGRVGGASGGVAGAVPGMLRKKGRKTRMLIYIELW